MKNVIEIVFAKSQRGKLTLVFVKLYINGFTFILLINCTFTYLLIGVIDEVQRSEVAAGTEVTVAAVPEVDHTVLKDAYQVVVILGTRVAVVSLAPIKLEQIEEIRLEMWILLLLLSIQQKSIMLP